MEAGSAITTVFKVLMIIIFSGSLLILLVYALMGHATWLIVANIIVISVSISIVQGIKHYRLTYICILLLIINLITFALIQIGKNPRPLTWNERRTIITHLEERYGDRGFKIIAAKSSNDHARKLLQYYTFKWKLYEAHLEDADGCDFVVQGENAGFNNLLTISEEYGIIRTIYDNRELFQSKITNLSATCVKRSGNTDYFQVNMKINYSQLNSFEFDENKEILNLNIIRDSILQSDTFLSDDELMIHVMYELKDGSVSYGFGEFKYDLS